MKKRFLVAVVMMCGGMVSAFPAAGNADTELDLGTIIVSQPDEGYDAVAELFGEDFDCVVEGNGASHKLNKSFYEKIINDVVIPEDIAFNRNPSAGWNPQSIIPNRNCTFRHTKTEVAKTTTFSVVHEVYGEGKLTTKCDMNLTMDVSFDYEMSIPATRPDGNEGVLPTTSASNWITDFGGTRTCAWNIIFGTPSSDGVTADNKLIGTIVQDFATLPEAKPVVSFKCKNLPKTLCVAYTYTSNVAVSSGEGRFAGVDAGEGVQTDTRMLPGALINMPFEVEGQGATVLRQSLDKSLRYPTLKISEVGAASQEMKSVITLKVTKRTLALRIKKTKTAKSLASAAKLKVLRSSRVSLKVSSTSSKNCKVSRSRLTGKKAGKCRVTVTVKPRKGKSVKKTLTVIIVK